MQNRSFLKPGSHLLTFYALSALIKSVPGNRSLEDGMSHPNDVAPESVRSYTLQDRFDNFCGVVYLHPQDPDFDTSLLRCVAVSRTASGVHNSSAEPPPSDDSDVRDRFAERQQFRESYEEISANNYFDEYGFEFDWQAYDVLVVAFGNDGTAERVGIGMCLVEGFWHAGPKRERISLK